MTKPEKVRIGAEELEELIGRVSAAVAQYQVTRQTLRAAADGGAPSLLFSTDEVTAFHFPPTRETALYLAQLTGVPLDPLRAELDLLTLPDVAELPGLWEQARRVPHYRGIGRLLVSRPVAGEEAVSWARSVDPEAVRAACRGVIAALAVTPEAHHDEIAADLLRRTGTKQVTWVAADVLVSHRQAVARLAQLRATAERLAEEATEAGRRLARRQVDTHLRAEGPEALEKATSERLRLGALRGLSIFEIAQASPRDLQRLDGVGEKTAVRAVAAARGYRRELADAARPRIDYTDKGPSTEYVMALARLLLYRDRLKGLPEGPFIEVPEIPAGDEIAVLSPADQAAVRWLGDADVPAAEPGEELTPEGAWALYAVRAAEFHAFGDDGRGHTGGLPEELVDRISGITLQGTVHASLRGYQSFGAKFVIAQRKVLIGDEQGLGKTLQALAAIVHVAATHDGPCQALVVCPPSLRLNWQREARRFTDLETFLIHGPDKEASFAAWEQRGGIAIVGYPEIRKNPRFTDPDEDVEILVVDEAHRVKNELSQQSQSVRQMTAAAGYVVYLTGTPLENRIEEFQTLIRYLNPELTPRTSTAESFRREIAPVYLRRNQEQVLDELPQLTESEDWVEPTAADEAAYESAVAAGNFMAMRAACARPRSAKLDRLVELVEETATTDKTIVFTYFREVIDAVLLRLAESGVSAFGPVAGGVTPEARQQLVDDFTAAAPGAVLVCQINAAGEGLNIQAANRVIIVEPQLNPAVEAQAIARAHRMGQVRTVEVHRLLTPDAVDERLVNLLSHKRALFDRYARDSAAAAAHPEALDVSEAKLIDELVAAERERLAVGPRL